jgi:Methyltransferase domain
MGASVVHGNQELMHAAAFAFVASVATDRPSGLVVELGGFNINGSIRELFTEPYLSTDIRPGRGVDVVADASTYVPPEPPACVVCCEVLEHTADAEAICRNAYRMLQPGGMFIVTAAGEGRTPHSSTDRPVTMINGVVILEEYYATVTEANLTRWLEDFASVQVTINSDAHDIYAVARKEQPRARAHRI